MNAPWGLVTSLKAAVLAIHFFDPARVAESLTTIGRAPDQKRALSTMDFVNYLEKTDAFEGRKPNLLRVVHILNAMVREGILHNFGSEAGKPRVFNDCFVYMHAVSANRVRAAARLWLAPVLGPEFLYHAVGTGVVHITGLNATGDETGGTGLILSTHTILTARHVVEDMRLHAEQLFQGVKCAVNDDAINVHDVEDVAFITVTPALTPVSGLVLHPPRVGQEVFTLGFPRIPRVPSAPLVMHSGEVTNQSVKLVGGETAFLYSATTRPGNSGGPIVSADGYLLGLVSKDLTMETDEGWFSPHYAGVDAVTILRAAHETRLGIELPFEGIE